MELLRSAKPDFLGINYYQTATNAANPLDGVGAGKMNTTGEKGSSEETGTPGMFKKSKIHLLIVPIGIGKLILKGCEWRYAVSLAAIGSQ